MKFVVLWYQIYWHGAVEHSGTMKVLQVLSLNLNLIYSTLQLGCNMSFVVSDMQNKSVRHLLSFGDHIFVHRLFRFCRNSHVEYSKP